MRLRSPVISAGILALIALAGVALVVRDAMPGSVRADNAGSLPFDNALSRFDRGLAEFGKGTSTGAALSPLARAALRAEPLDAEAIMFANVAAHTPTAVETTRRLTLAETVNKRSITVQLALIEDAVTKGDIKRALIHYDRTMIAHQQSMNIFFPILKSAVDNPQIRTALVPYIQADRAWARPFLQYLIDNVPPKIVAAFFVDFGGGSRITAARPLERTLLARLIVSGDADVARRYAGIMRPDRAVGLDDLAVNPVSSDPVFGPLAWTAEEGSIDTSLRAGQIDVTVPAGASGIVATRVMVITPGAKRLSYSLETDGDPLARLDWEGTCLNGNTEDRLWSHTIVAMPGRLNLQTQVNIPSRCKAVRFDLHVDGSEVQLSTRLRLYNLGLQPL